MDILLVEDDAPIRRLVCSDLERADMTVVEAGTVASALASLRERVFDIVILDLTLPDGSGLEVLAHLRREGLTAHVIVLSAAASEYDRLRGLDLGADDYVVKPFFARELTARVRAVRRRRTPLDTTLRIGAVELDLAARRVLVGGVEVDLSPREYSLLAFLAARPGQAFSREELLRAVWESAPEWQAAATVTEHIHRLRTKLEVDPGQPRMLHTVRGLGYRLDDPTKTVTLPAGAPDVGAVGVWIHVGGVIVSSDGPATALMGATDEAQIVSKHLLDFVAPQSLHAAEERMRATMSGRTPRSQVMIARLLDGSELPIQVSNGPAVWQGQPAGRVELMRAVDASGPFRQLVTGIASEVADAMIVTDRDSHIRSWNAGAERLYGWSESEVLGRHVLDIIEWDGDASELEAARSELEATDHWHGEGRQITRDGTSVVVRVSSTLVRDEGDEIIGVVSVNRLVSPSLTPLPGPMLTDVRELRRALDEGELDVYYQPVVVLHDRTLIALEALVRWHHPERGLLCPDAFLATAEGSGLILGLGAFVLERACRQAVEWRRSGADVNIAVNISARELADPLLADRVVATLAAAELDPSTLWLELTETALIDDVVQVGVTLQRLAGLGIGLSIDDFGTGWASLTYLKSFPIHVLKIDRSFVTDVVTNPSDAAIIRSILDLGAELGHVVVAEGIETVAQQQRLEALGCSIGQGYLYGEPTPASEVRLEDAHRLGVRS